MWQPRLSLGDARVAAALLVLFIAMSGCSIGRHLAAPAAQPQRADVIVALGGGAGDRERTALALWRQGLAPRVLLTGFAGTRIGLERPDGAHSAEPGTRHDHTPRARILLDSGIPASAILYDHHARDSCEEAIVTRAVMERNGWKSALVISDPPHLRRLDWAWSRVFAGTGLSYRLVAAASPWWHEDWWRDQRSSDFALSEVVKFAYYVLVSGCAG